MPSNKVKLGTLIEPVENRNSNEQYSLEHVRGIATNLDMDRFYEIKIPVPDTKIQQSIVNIYNAYNKRKEINEKLKAQIKEICPILIKGSIEEAKRGCKNVPAAIWNYIKNNRAYL